MQTTDKLEYTVMGEFAAIIRQMLVLKNMAPIQYKDVILPV